MDGDEEPTEQQAPVVTTEEQDVYLVTDEDDDPILPVAATGQPPAGPTTEPVGHILATDQHGVVFVTDDGYPIFQSDEDPSMVVHHYIIPMVAEQQPVRRGMRIRPPTLQEVARLDSLQQLHSAVREVSTRQQQVVEQLQQLADRLLPVGRDLATVDQSFQDQSHHDKSHQDQSHQDQSHQDQSHQDQSHQDQSHHDQSHQDQSHQDQSHQDQSHQDQSHQDQSHQDQSHQDQSHQDQSHQDQSHRDQSHEDQSHRDQSHLGGACLRHQDQESLAVELPPNSIPTVVVDSPQPQFCPDQSVQPHPHEELSAHQLLVSAPAELGLGQSPQLSQQSSQAQVPNESAPSSTSCMPLHEAGGYVPSAKLDLKKQKEPKVAQQQKMSAQEKHQKKLAKQLVGENLERMNYLYQCSRRLARTDHQIYVTDGKEIRGNSTTRARKYFNPSTKQASSLSKIQQQTCSTKYPDSDSGNSTFGGEADTTCSSSSSVVVRPKCPEIVCNLASTCRGIGRKCQLRLSHHIKRELCPGCATPLVPAVNATAKIVRVRKKRVLMLRCLCCGARRKRPCDQVKVLWNDTPQANLA